MPMSLSNLLDRSLFDPYQWREIVRGDRALLNFLAYADPKFNADQMGEIIQGLSKGLDASIYANPKYTADQMCYIRWGLEQHLNILAYNSPDNSVEEMKWWYDEQRWESGEPAWDGYIPLGRETAEWLFCRGAKIILLNADKSLNRPAELLDQLADHPGLSAIPENDLKSMSLFLSYRLLCRCEAELLTASDNRFGIYQVKDGGAYRKFLFEGLEQLNSKGLTVRRENYQLAYVGYYEPGDTLNTIYQHFNLNHPEDYTGRSLSISDVLVLHRGGKTEVRYVDSYDFPEIRGFFGETMLARNNGREAAYELEGGKHLTIEMVADGQFLSTIVGPDFLDISNITTAPDLVTIEQARQNAAALLNLDGPMREINYETFMERAGLASQEPTVEILWAEGGGLHGGRVLRLHDADLKFKELDAEIFAKTHGKYCNKTRFEITYLMGGELRTYEGRQELGDGVGGLIERIEGLFTYYRNSAVWQEHLAENGDQGQNETYDHILNSFIPYLKKHVELAGVSAEANMLIVDPGSTGQEEGPIVAYGVALSEYVTACRRELNTAQVPEFPLRPQREDFLRNPETAVKLEQEKRALWHEARAHGKTPRKYLNDGGAVPKGASAKPPRRHRRSRPKGLER